MWINFETVCHVTSLFQRGSKLIHDLLKLELQKQCQQLAQLSAVFLLFGLEMGGGPYSTLDKIYVNKYGIVFSLQDVKTLQKKAHHNFTKVKLIFKMCLFCSEAFEKLEPTNIPFLSVLADTEAHRPLY